MNSGEVHMANASGARGTAYSEALPEGGWSCDLQAKQATVSTHEEWGWDITAAAHNR
jgi:hypothetical protein